MRDGTHKSALVICSVPQGVVEGVGKGEGKGEGVGVGKGVGVCAVFSFVQTIV